LFCELHSQISTLVLNVLPFASHLSLNLCCDTFTLALSLNTFYIPKPRLVRQHFITWRVSFRYFMDLVVNLVYVVDVSWWSFGNSVVLLLYMPFILFLLENKKEENNKIKENQQKKEKSFHWKK